MERNRSSKAKGRALRQNPRNLNGNAGSSGGSIPPLRSNVVKHHRFRFTASSACVKSQITGTTLLGACGVVGTVVNTTGAYVNRTVRLRSVHVWAPTATSNSPTTCAVEWLGSANSPNLEISDTSINVSKPASLHVKPPPNSLASFWTGFSSTIFLLDCPGGSVVDVSVDYIEMDTTTPVTTGLTTVALGVLYYLALDGPATNKLVPVSLTTTS